MIENQEKQERVHKLKGRKDPFSELMDEKEESQPAKGNALSEEEMVNPPTTEMPVEEEDEDYTHLLMEEGIHEEDIRVSDQEKLNPHSMRETRPISAEQIREKLVLKAQAHAREDLSAVMRLELLELPNKKAVFIGRKKGVLQKAGLDGALYMGKVQDEEKYREHKLYLDSLNPHVVFVCGSRGSGKSYVLGVMVEELAHHNPNVGIVVVDPVGVFWSMRYPNKEEKEVKELAHYDLLPQGLNNLVVFIPEGMKSETPKSTYDSTFTIPPALLTSEDWCLTFGIDRFSPTGLLMEKALKKVEKGYRNMRGETIPAKKGEYGLSDLVLCLETDTEINSKEKGYRPDSVRALVSRFEAAKSWGIFSEKGTPLSKISKAGQLTVIDTSFLDDTVTALVIGILSRRLLAARKLQTRKEAAGETKEDAREKAVSVESLLENEIPPTWLFIDEAHTLIPSGNISTPATSAIVEYVKQGRRPGCSLVFATQQPSAIDTRVLSQLDIILSHKLIFDDDIKAVTKRTPTIIPMKYKHSYFLKTLPVGTALVGDRREETNRAFVLKIRPRMSQHEGRDAETGERKRELSETDVQQLGVEMLITKLEKNGLLGKEMIDQVVQTLNQKYGQHVLLSNVLDELEQRGAEINPQDASIKWPPFYTSESAEEKAVVSPKRVRAKVAEQLTKLIQPPREEEETSLQAYPITLSQQAIVEKLVRASKKNLLGLGKPIEKLEEVNLVYAPILRVKYRQFTGKTTFVARECFIDAEKGEFLHFLKNRFVSSTGLRAVAGLDEQDMKILRLLYHHPNQNISGLEKRLNLEQKLVKHSLVKLVDRRLIRAKGEERNPVFSVENSLDIPVVGDEKALSSLQSLKLVNVSNIQRERTRISEEKIHTLLSTLWPHVMVESVSEIYRPLFETMLVNPKTGEHRVVRLDGFTGSLLDE